MYLRLGFVAAVTAGCSAPATQTISGHIEAGFPTTVTSVKVTTSTVDSWHGDAEVVSAPVSADGTFRVDVLALNGLRLHLIGDGQSKLVFPRQAGTIDTSFAILGAGADFDLGAIRYVGDVATTTIVFHQTGTGTGTDTECDDDGHDANGAMCVDDADDDHNTCHQKDKKAKKAKHGHGDGDDGEQEDGEQDGGNDDGEGEHQDGEGEHDDGDHQDGEHDDDGDGPDMGDAVAEHNFPADGCSDDKGDDNEGDDGED